MTLLSSAWQAASFLVRVSIIAKPCSKCSWSCSASCLALSSGLALKPQPKQLYLQGNKDSGFLGQAWMCVAKSITLMRFWQCGHANFRSEQSLASWAAMSFRRDLWPQP